MTATWDELHERLYRALDAPENDWALICNAQADLIQYLAHEAAGGIPEGLGSLIEDLRAIGTLPESDQRREQIFQRKEAASEKLADGGSVVDSMRTMAIVGIHWGYYRDGHEWIEDGVDLGVTVLTELGRSEEHALQVVTKQLETSGLLPPE